MYKPSFINQSYTDTAVPFTGLSMREIYARFCSTGDYNGITRPGSFVEDPENAANSELDADDKYIIEHSYPAANVDEFEASQGVPETPSQESSE